MTVLTILTFLSKKTALPYSVDAILLDKMLAVLLGWVSTVLPDRFAIVLSGSITAELHDSTDDPDFFVQKASIDPQYYGSTVCSITSVLRQDADVAWDRRRGFCINVNVFQK